VYFSGEFEDKDLWIGGLVVGKNSEKISC